MKLCRCNQLENRFFHPLPFLSKYNAKFLLTSCGNAAMTAEKRKHVRRKTGVRGMIAATERAARFECLVTDMSQTGARIITKTKVEMPESFLLFLLPRGTRRCTTIWQRGEQLGVRFRYPLATNVDPK
jgi:PilZ domain-containing protein